MLSSGVPAPRERETDCHADGGSALSISSALIRCPRCTARSSKLEQEKFVDQAVSPAS
jgi:hypothetical protein